MKRYDQLRQKAKTTLLEDERLMKYEVAETVELNYKD